MSWIHSLLARLAERRPHQPTEDPSQPCRSEHDVFAELIAASSLLDFGGTLPEPRFKETDLDRGLRPW